MKRRLTVPLVLLSAAVLPGALRGGDVYYSAPLDALALKAPERAPAGDPGGERERMRRREVLFPYAVLEGPGEVYLKSPAGGTWGFDASSVLQQATLAARAPGDREVKGWVFAGRPDGTELEPRAFTLPPSARHERAERDFHAAREEHYERLLSLDLPGAAWFRHQAREERKILAERFGEKDRGAGAEAWRGMGRRRAGDLEETYDLFTGGRALSENLQLDRLLNPAGAGEETVELSTLPGITVKEMDWKALLKDLKPESDPLAALVPADQHALFFPGFDAMVRLLDEADRQGTPVLGLLEPRSEDARTRERYQKQLCLPLSDISRLLGSQVVKSVAFTGSDPFLRTGSDVAILFEAKSPELLKTFLAAQQAAAGKACPGAAAVEGAVESVSYRGLVSPDRSVSSYLASLGATVVVTNSLHQVRQLAQVAGGKSPALASSEEYQFFRGRYRRGEPVEMGFLVVPDAAIRRWCGPRWRIADSRRIRAAAALSELAAAHLPELAHGDFSPRPLRTDLAVPGFTELFLEPSGPRSSLYGTLEFQTPIAEIPLCRVTTAEAEAYRRFREGYQANWRRYFDPLAVRFTVAPQKVGVDLTVMPLIEGTEYGEFISLTRGGSIPPGAGDPHAGALVHFALALNPEAPMLRQASSLLSGAARTPGANVLAWLGGSVAVYADDDPFWEEMAKAANPLKFLETEYYRLPLALHCEVKDTLGLAAFLTTLRAFAEQTAPGMTVWETLKHGDQAYVKVSASPAAQGHGELGKASIYYSPAPGALLVSLNEAVLKRALDRRAGRKPDGPDRAAGASPRECWIGSSLGLKIDARAWGPLQTLCREEYEQALERRAWANIPILNEWKRLFPEEDPLKVHERLWKVKLVCPGGGAYVWNERYRTLESTVYGHPGDPRKLGPAPFPLAGVLEANFGLTFENSGLRARVELTQKPAR